MMRQKYRCQKSFARNTFVLFFFFIFFSPPVLAGETIAAISAHFLDSPYQLDPLGEGAHGEFDQEPLYRFDVFDCQTYVETVLALYLSNDQNSFEKKLLSIRYANGKANYFQRNHFICTDWIPSNIEQKNVRYLDLPRFKYDFISVLINKKYFYEHIPLSRIRINGLSETEKLKKLAVLHSHANVIENIKASLPYVPLNKIPEVIQKIPEGAIILIIKPEKGLLISHMGFAIRKNGIVYLRAASSYWGKVIDVPLQQYLQKEAAWKRVKGISLLMPEPKN